jgi:hypothetical protein
MTTRALTIAAAVAASLGLGGASLAQQPTAQQVNPSPMTPGSRAGDAPGMNSGNNTPGATAQQVNPSPIPPGSHANQAPALNPQARQMGQGSPDSTGAVPGMSVPAGRTTDAGRIGGTGAAAPSGQPDVARGTAPQAQGGAMAPTAGSTAATTPGANDGTRDNPSRTPGAQTTQATEPGAAPGGAANRSTGDATGGAMTGATTPGASTQGGGTAPPAATTQHTEPRTAAAPVSGANSFTEGQARARMADAGFNDVQELRLDEQGVWRGRAMRNGQQTGVALDYQGNVVGQ